MSACAAQAGPAGTHTGEDFFPGNQGDKEKRVLCGGIVIYRLHISRSYTAFYEIDKEEKLVIVQEILPIEQDHKKQGSIKRRNFRSEIFFILIFFQYYRQLSYRSRLSGNTGSSFHPVSGIRREPPGDPGILTGSVPEEVSERGPVLCTTAEESVGRKVYRPGMSVRPTATGMADGDETFTVKPKGHIFIV